MFTTNSCSIITAMQTFVYLSLTLHFTLQDIHDLCSCIKKASQMMGALNFYWNCEEVETWAKAHIYQTFLLSISGVRKIGHSPKNSKIVWKYINHRSIRCILKIRMLRVKEEKNNKCESEDFFVIQNESKKFSNIINSPSLDM